MLKGLNFLSKVRGTIPRTGGNRLPNCVNLYLEFSQGVHYVPQMKQSKYKDVRPNRTREGAHFLKSCSLPPKIWIFNEMLVQSLRTPKAA